MSRKKTKQKQKHKTSAKSTLSGSLDIARSGIGYVVIQNGSGDVLVRPGNFNTALHGDVVKVRVTKENFGSGRKEGKIMEIVERKRTEFIGTLQLSTSTLR